MNKQICDTNSSMGDSLKQIEQDGLDRDDAFFRQNLRELSGFEKYIPDVCFCIAGCAKPTKYTEMLFPRVKGGRISEDSLFDAICHAYALDHGLKYQDNPYVGKGFSDSKIKPISSYFYSEYNGVGNYWCKTKLIPQLKQHLGRDYTREHDGEMFGEYWLAPKDETVAEYMTYWKPTPYILFFFPLFGQFYFLCFIANLLFALFTKKWSGEVK